MIEDWSELLKPLVVFRAVSFPKHQVSDSTCWGNLLIDNLFDLPGLLVICISFNVDGIRVFRTWSVERILFLRCQLEMCNGENIMNSPVLGNVQSIYEPTISLDHLKGTTALLWKLLTICCWKLVTLMQLDIRRVSNFEEKWFSRLIVPEPPLGVKDTHCTRMKSNIDAIWSNNLLSHWDESLDENILSSHTRFSSNFPSHLENWRYSELVMQQF